MDSVEPRGSLLLISQILPAFFSFSFDDQKEIQRLQNVSPVLRIETLERESRGFFVYYQDRLYKGFREHIYNII